MNKELLYQNKKIYYRIIGTGKPVMFIHGFGEEGEIWNNQVGFLKDNLPAGKAGFQLIIPDLPGSGKSEMIGDMSIEGMAEVIKKIFDTEALSHSHKEPVLIGHSMGGYITLAFVEKYPDHFSAFGLFHSSAYADNEEKIVARHKGIEFITKHGAFEFLKTTIPNLFSPNSKEQIPESIEEIMDRGHNFSSPALVSYYKAMIQRPDRTEVLRKAIVPVLFIMGKYDNAIPLEDGLKQCHLPEKSYIHILHQAGHMGMLEEPVTSNMALERFLLET